MRTLILVWMSAIFACSGSSMPVSIVVDEATGELTELGWLAGSWASDKDQLVEEHWTTPSTNLMLGINRTVSQGTTKHYEELRIEVRPDGIFYVASPLGQETTSFKLIEQGKMHVVFENLQHDYPKRITYRRSQRSLTVRIEGDEGERTAEWTWSRTVLPYD